MNNGEGNKIELFCQLAEVKRSYSSIEKWMEKNGPKSLVITSASKGEGKTLLAAGLGLIAARWAQKRVLLLDMNWYVPSLHTYFGHEPGLDLAALPSERPISSLVKRTTLSGLDILTAPTGDQQKGASSIDSTQIGLELMRHAQDAYDLVIVDTSSVFPTNRYMADPVILGHSAGGVLMVVLTNVTPRQTVKRARMFLENSGTKLAGVITNQWKNNIY